MSSHKTDRNLTELHVSSSHTTERILSESIVCSILPFISHMISSLMNLLERECFWLREISINFFCWCRYILLFIHYTCKQVHYYFFFNLLFIILRTQFLFSLQYIHITLQPIISNHLCRVLILYISRDIHSLKLTLKGSCLRNGLRHYYNLLLTTGSILTDR